MEAGRRWQGHAQSMRAEQKRSGAGVVKSKSGAVSRDENLMQCECNAQQGDTYWEYSKEQESKNETKNYHMNAQTLMQISSISSSFLLRRIFSNFKSRWTLPETINATIAATLHFLSWQYQPCWRVSCFQAMNNRFCLQITQQFLPRDAL